MLEFTKVFTKGQYIDMNNIEMIKKCKNIDYGHTYWTMHIRFYTDITFVTHVIDNIIDVNAHNDGDKNNNTYFIKILRYASDPRVLHYVFNNGYINEKSFDDYLKCDFYGHLKYFCRCCPRKQFDKLTSYLTKVSLNKFKGYYNIEKYYDIIYTMLLILKTQQKLPHIGSTLPSAVIKHLIIPFIYQ